MHLTAPGNLGSQPLTLQYNNDTTTGTVQFLLAKAGGNATTPSAIKIATTDTNVQAYPVVSTTGTSGAALLAVSGVSICTFDNATTYGDYVVASTTTAADCHDSGIAPPSLPPGPVWVVGVVDATGGAAGNYAVKGPGFFITAGGGGSTTMQINGANTAAQSPINFQSGTGVTVTNPSAGNVSISTAPATMFFSGWHGGSNSSNAANVITVSGFYLPYPVTFSHIAFIIAAADASTSDFYDVGVYSHSGALQADIGAMNMKTAGIADKTAKQGAITLPPGQYYVAVTGNAAVANFDVYGCGTFYSESGSNLGSSSGGASPASFTSPADAFNSWSDCIDFVLH